jgi:hypothetical protein
MGDETSPSSYMVILVREQESATDSCFGVTSAGNENGAAAVSESEITFN